MIESAGFCPKTSSDSGSSRAALFPALIVFVLLFIGLLMALLLKNNGIFTYTLDDPYIHLALASRILHGEYGVNAGEWAAPCSSILWPFLLAPFAATRIGLFVPLILNFLASIGVICIFNEFIHRSLLNLNDVKRRFFHPLILIILIPTIQLVGLAFTGMEHSVQFFLTALFFFGFLRWGETGHPSWWLIAAIVLGPLIRYENLALSLPAIIVIGLRGYRKSAVIAGLCIILPVAGFSGMLQMHGLGVLPTSVIAKILNPPPLSSNGGHGSVVENLVENLVNRQGTILAFFSVLLLAVVFQNRLDAPNVTERLIAFLAVLGTASLLVFGKIGWFSRYEIYLWGNLLVITIWVFRNPLVAFIDYEPIYKSILLGFAAITITGMPYLMITLAVPAAAHNIYGHQYQMHRFAQEFYAAPIAVNDLGLVVYGNNSYVLDLLGLASKRALEARRPGASPDWMNNLARERNVRFAMVYPGVFPVLPTNWKLLGYLVFTDACLISPEPRVAFYALDEEIIPRIKSLLETFSVSLPSCTHFEGQ
ncbi:MAG: hypothetical protein HQM09_05825 [Candidatus Riflebacteria bacterium]|nr:hypothetical protein [Candidatus Riflebacteria bacterium]